MNRFDKIAKEWDEAQRRQKMALSIFKGISKKIKFTTKQTVADLGAGTGLLLFQIQPLVKHITAFDNSAGMLEVLAKKAKDILAENVDIQLFNADTEEIPTQKFEVIVSSMAVHHIQDTRHILSSCFTALKKNGSLAIADLEPEDGSFHSEDAMSSVFHLGFEPENFAELMRTAGFTDVTTDRVHTIDKEGRKYHVFLAHGIKTK